jgi:hypothetical protein
MEVETKKVRSRTQDHEPKTTRPRARSQDQENSARSSRPGAHDHRPGTQHSGKVGQSQEMVEPRLGATSVGLFGCCTTLWSTRKVSVASGLVRNKCGPDPRRVGSASDWVGLRSARTRLGIASSRRWARPTFGRVGFGSDQVGLQSTSGLVWFGSGCGRIGLGSDARLRGSMPLLCTAVSDHLWIGAA